MKPLPKKRSIRDFFVRAPSSLQTSQESQPARPQTCTGSAPQHVPRENPTLTPHAHAIAVPASSQTPAVPAASRRIVSNGQDVVLNSDSESDSLPELDFGIVAAPKPSAAETTTTITTRSKRISENDDDGLRIPTKKVKDDKRKFNALVQTAQKKLETERRIQEHKAVLDEPVPDAAATSVAINRETLGQVVQDDDDDPDKARRLLQAMERTNAMQMESTFYFFFDDDADTASVQTKFPRKALSHYRWASIFQAPSTRDQAFMTGVARQIFRVQHLPRELASWMIDQICCNQNEALNCRYFEILEVHHDHLYTLIDPQRLDAMFKATGANMALLEANAQLLPVSVPPSEIKTLLPPPLKSIIRLLARAAPWLHTATRSHALYLLCHVCLDNRVTADYDTLHAVQDAMEAIMCNFADNSELKSGLNEFVPQLLTRVTHPLLQRSLVCALPAKSPLTAYLQRHLALSFLVHPKPVNTSLTDDKAHDLVFEHITESLDFFVNKNTDYGQLAARLALLDIAIGPGLLNVPYQPLSSSTPTEVDSSPIQVPVPASSEVKQFNQRIDALAQQIKLLGNSIVEVGAVVDITILEIKNSVERICARLEHASRIGGKVHNVFGSEDEDAQLRLSKFFKKARRPSASASSRGVFTENEGSALDSVGLTHD